MYFDHKWNVHSPTLNVLNPPVYPMGGMGASDYFTPWGFARLGAEEEAPVTDEALVLLRSTKSDLEHLREVMDKDLFWRRISAAATIAGTVFAAVKLVDILVAIRRRTP